MTSLSGHEKIYSVAVFGLTVSFLDRINLIFKEDYQLIDVDVTLENTMLENSLHQFITLRIFWATAALISRPVIKGCSGLS